MDAKAQDLLRRAIEHHQAGRLDEADPLYRKVLEREPREPDALHLLALIELLRGRNEEAAALIERALEAAGPHAALLNSLGKAYFGLKRLADAKRCFARSAALEPGFAEAHGNLGAALTALGDFAAAVESLNRAIGIQPAYPNAHFNLARALSASGRVDEAEHRYRAALDLDPAMVDAHSALGDLLKSGSRLGEAEASYRAALALGASAEVRRRLADVLYEQDRLDEAEAEYRGALELDPGLAPARWALGILDMLKRVRAGRGAEAAAQLAQLAEDFRAHPPADAGTVVGAMQPFHLAYREDDPRELLALHGRLCADLMRRWQERRGVPGAFAPSSAGRLRVGIVSGQVRDHSVWNAITRGWVRHLDRNRFEVSLFHLGQVQDAETQFARDHAAHFEEGPRALGAWADAILARCPDALLYPEIGMDPATLQLASLRLAPLQIAVWGHPITTGLPTIDAYLSAEAFEPADAQAAYTERLVKLPGLGCCYAASALEHAEVDPASLGIAPGAPLLICAGTPYKYAPGHDRIYAEIVRRAGDCRLVFFAQNPRSTCEALMRRLRRAFGEAGLDYERHVVFAPVLPRAAFHGLMRRSDAMLDTIGFSGFNTAMQAVECGLPIVAYEGRFMRGRFASGILGRMGMHEWVAAGAEQYVALAAEMAGKASRRQEARERVAAARDVLFDDLEPVRALEGFLLESARP